MNRQYNLDKKTIYTNAGAIKFAGINLATDFLKTRAYTGNFGNIEEFIGKPIETTVKLIAPQHSITTYNADSNNYHTKTIPEAEIILDAVVIEVRRSKNIIKTSINGLHGTVKEYISDGDWELQFAGAISNTRFGVNARAKKEYPREDVNKLQQILNAPIAIKVVSEFLGLFEVDTIVVENMDFPSREAIGNTQLFAFNASSDKTIELNK